MDIEIRTTCRPERDEETFFKLNPIVLQAIHNEFQIKLFNEVEDLPFTLRSHENLELIELNGEVRPSIAVLAKEIRTNYVLICNSDIFIGRKSIQKIKDLPTMNHAAISGRRYDLHDNIYYHNQIDDQSLIDTGYRQSSRTLDYFILGRKTIEEISYANNLKSLKLGTVEFDVRLASWLNEREKLIDGSDFLTIFHRNHENFRSVMRTSILLDLRENVSFASNRRVTEFNKEDTRFGGLEYSKFYIDSAGSITRRKVPYVIQMIVSKSVIKLANRIEKLCYGLNFLIFRLFKRTGKILVISRKFKVAFLIPYGTKIKDVPFKVAIAEVLDRDIVNVLGADRLNKGS